MKRLTQNTAATAWPALCLLLLTACQMHKTVSYHRDVEPVLAANCLACHSSPSGTGYRTVGLEMSSYQRLMQGTLYGPVVKPGDSQCSILMMMVEGRVDATMRMPHNASEPLTARDIEVLRLWIDQGALDN